MDNKNEFKTIPTCYFTDGKPVPLVLTEEELISLLRLDIDGPRHPHQTLQYYREMGKLRGIQIGKRIRYYLPDILKFLEEQSSYTSRKNAS